MRATLSILLLSLLIGCEPGQIRPGDTDESGDLDPDPNERDLYLVGGRVAGLQGEGLVLTMNPGAQSVQIAPDQRDFTFDAPVRDGFGYVVTIASYPVAPVQGCTIAGGSGSVRGADVTSIAVTCTTATFPVSGTVGGLAAGSSLVLRNNGANDLLIERNGAFSFANPVPDLDPFHVTVASQPAVPPQQCAVAGGQGVIDGAAVTDVEVTCRLECSPTAACPSTAWCDAPCGGSGLCELRPTSCPDTPAPVCGCDNRTYANACEANRAGVAVQSEGECAGSGGCVDNRECERRHFCEKETGACRGSGVCAPIPETCLGRYDPVCGCDNRTYGNECEAHRNGVSVNFRGECRSM